MTTIQQKVSGYDDLTVRFLVSANPGSYLLSTFYLNTDDFVSPYRGDVNNVPQLIQNINQSFNLENKYLETYQFEYVYESPSVRGLYYLASGCDTIITNPLSVYNTGQSYLCAEKILPASGLFIPVAWFNTVKNIYDNCSTISKESSAEIKVLERWPEPKFNILPTDDATLRKDKFCHTEWGGSGLGSRFDKADTIRKESNSSKPLRYDITYGTDPVQLTLRDFSIARTWPVSSWHISLSTNNPYMPTVTDDVLVTDGSLFLGQDQINNGQILSSYEFRYGDYQLTMNVQASTTSTSSDKEFIQYIKIAEFEPFANFWAYAAQTVPFNFSASDADITPQLLNVSPIHNGSIDVDGSTYPFVSGYAPNLTVWFQDSSEAHTFPIKSYHWNFGDIYNEGPRDITDVESNYYTVSTSSHTGDWDGDPVCWTTDVQEHTARHVYMMPGTYDVTLTVKASETNTMDVCSRYTQGDNDTRKFYVYVEEIYPVCNEPIWMSLSPDQGFTQSTNIVSGGSPLTAYFVASGIIAGSFPICRIDWDFGDGTIEKTTRIPLTQTTSQGLPVTNIAAYDYDLTDPRNFVIPHIYTNTTDDELTYNIAISAYACNTNTMLPCTGTAVGPVIEEPSTPPKTSNRKIVASRVTENGELIYTMQDQDDKTTYTVVLTGEI